MRTHVLAYLTLAIPLVLLLSTTAQALPIRTGFQGIDEFNPVSALYYDTFNGHVRTVSAFGLILAYDMQTCTENDLLRDFSGQENHGSITGTNVGGGLFDSGRHYEELTDQINTNLAPTNSSFSLSSWVFPTNLTSADDTRGVFGKRTHPAPQPAEREWILAVRDSNNDLVFSWWTGYPSGFGWSVNSDNNVVTLNTWTHIGFSLDIDTLDYHFYANGAPAGNGTLSSAPDWFGNPSNSIRIGRARLDPDQHWEGLIDDTQIWWDHVLTDDEYTGLGVVFPTTFNPVGRPTLPPAELSIFRSLLPILAPIAILAVFGMIAWTFIQVYKGFHKDLRTRFPSKFGGGRLTRTTTRTGGKTITRVVEVLKRR